MKYQSATNNFPFFQNENERHLCQENDRHMDRISKMLLITCLAFRTKTEVIYVKKREEKRIEITNGVE